MQSPSVGSRRRASVRDSSVLVAVDPPLDTDTDGMPIVKHRPKRQRSPVRAARSASRGFKLPDDFRLLLTCPCCMEIKTCPYVECASGHSVCVECVVKMMHVHANKSIVDADLSGHSLFCRSAPPVSCPTCRQPVDLQKRSRLLESMVGLVPICGCEYKNCPLEDATMTKKEAVDHELTCEYKTVPCPFQVNNYLCDNRCNRSYRPGELMEHLRDHHDVVASTATSTKDGPGGPSCSKTMARRFEASLQMKVRRVSNPRRSHRSGTKVCSVMLDVLFTDRANLDGFMAGRQARLYVVKHREIMYSIYVSLLNNSEHVSVTVRGDFSMSVLTADGGTPPVRICTMYPRQLTSVVATALFSDAFSAKNSDVGKKQTIDRAVWVDHQSKLVTHCPSFTSLIECEPTHRLAITECGPGQEIPYSVDTGHVVCIPNAEFVADFCKPCANPSCDCLGHFRVRVEFPDTV